MIEHYCADVAQYLSVCDLVKRTNNQMVGLCVCEMEVDVKSLCFELWTGELDECSPCLQRREAESTLIYGEMEMKKEDEKTYGLVTNTGFAQGDAVTEEVSGTLTCTSNNQREPDLGRLQCLTATGVDAFNQTLTGDVCMTMTNKASDANHIPCVATKTCADSVTLNPVFAGDTLVSEYKSANGEEVCATITKSQGKAPSGTTRDNTEHVMIYNTADAVRMREGKEGGGKGPLVSEDTSLTIAKVNDQSVFCYNDCGGGSVLETTTYALDGDKINKNERQGGNGMGWNDSGAGYTLTKADRHAVAYSKTCRPKEAGECPTFKETGVANTLNRFDNGEVRANELACEVYTVDSERSNSMKSSNPNSGIHLANVSTCLDTTVPTPQKAQGGQMIVAYNNHQQDSRVTECKGGVINTLPAIADSGGNLPFVVKADMVSVYDNHPNDSRVTECKGGAVNTISTRAGTGGGNLPFAANHRTGVVRRLTPLECERLMGFPDEYTKIPYRGKPAEDCPDSPRYAACGNSMCVNVMRWIGERIQMYEDKKK